MESFWNDLYYEEIHFRDNLQFELQSDFSPQPTAKENISIQEFYFFIPSALQVNRLTYSKEQFYKDRTNLIRYKTPEFSFRELLDKNNQFSPMTRIVDLSASSETEKNIQYVQDEIKLLANIIRSALRVGTRGLIDVLSSPITSVSKERLERQVETLCNEIKELRLYYLEIQTTFLSHWSGNILQSFFYVDEFMSNCIDYYLTGFLSYLRSLSIDGVHVIDSKIGELVAEEKRYRQKYYQEAKDLQGTKTDQESVLFHRNLLSKYVLDALLLGFERISWADKYGNIFAGAAAGIAMLVYGFLLFLNLPTLGINSLPFLFVTVILYILKDRIKDSLKTLFHQKAGQWLSDYTTNIKGINSEATIGQLKEFFSFLIEKDLPDEIKHAREAQFSSDLPFFKQPEELFYYKKEMSLRTSESLIRARRHKIHNIFLFNIHLLLEKASNPTEPLLSLDPDTMELTEYELPKVYYINIIMKNSYFDANLNKRIELKKFCMVIDKNGIKRIEIVS
jgi:hypothetical protein